MNIYTKVIKRIRQRIDSEKGGASGVVIAPADKSKTKSFIEMKKKTDRVCIQLHATWRPAVHEIFNFGV